MLPQPWNVRAQVLLCSLAIQEDIAVTHGKFVCVEVRLHSATSTSLHLIIWPEAECAQAAQAKINNHSSTK